ncbi:MAG TPA: hypothetical protein PK307_12370 [Spirochaetota bacterium]|nr:hypothetical protein [Spirochaetota bacterium]HOD13871.1 hypothetical protein [Spirochaetota bacterium]HPG52125.1 hypothetical protein [Spirochaetota bacterium]HPN14189.1 hypothetical protein [Spirochaetota bacterium]HQL82992.1 hypothetical protein [Spirochaetota bacterium]
MISIRSISLEYKTTMIFAVIALVLSLVTGFATGVRWGVVLLRSVILCAVFAGIGFGICMIVRKFVPEVYQFLAMMAGIRQAADAGDQEIGLTETGTDDNAGGEPFAVEGGAEGVGPAAGASPGEFTELEKEGLAHYSTASGGTSVNTGSGKLGKHILEKEKMAKYEPKIMAQAVRTMMSKDRE